MNAFTHYVAPSDGVNSGIGASNAIFNMMTAARLRRQQEEARNALSRMGQEPYLLGLEGIEGANRPDYLKTLYQDNPEAAMELEKTVSAPFMVDRDVKKAIEMERGKLKARTDAWGPLFPGFAESPINAMDTRSTAPASVGVTTDEGVLPPGGGVLANPGQPGYMGDVLQGNGLAGLSGLSRTMKFSLEHGPYMEIAGLSPLDAELKRRESMQKGRQVELEAQRTTDQIESNRTARVQQAHERVLALRKSISELQEKKDAGARNPREVLRELDALTSELRNAQAYRDSLVSGKEKPAPSVAELTQEEKDQAAAVRNPTRQGAASQDTPLNAAVGGGLPYKQQMEVRQKATQEKIAIANKAIEDAHAGAAKANDLNDAVARMLGIVNEGAGSTFMGALPFGAGEAIMSIGHDNKRLATLRDQLIDVFKTEGQTKAFDTLPELKIVSARIPDLGKSEDQNREDMAALVNLMSARSQAGNFLESWANSHNGTIDGARKVMSEWMKHNPSIIAERLNGKTVLKDVQQIPLETWAKLIKKYPAQEIRRRWDAMQNGAE